MFSSLRHTTLLNSLKSLHNNILRKEKTRDQIRGNIVYLVKASSTQISKIFHKKNYHVDSFL